MSSTPPPPQVHLVELVENRTAPPPNTKALFFSNKTISLITEYYMKVNT